MEIDSAPIKEEVNESIDDIKPDLTTNVTICHDNEPNLNSNSNVMQKPASMEEANSMTTVIDTQDAQDQPMSL